MRPATTRLGAVGVLGRLSALVATSAVLGVLVAAVAAPFVALVGVATHSLADQADKLPEEMPLGALAQRTRVLDRRGNVIATFYDKHRINVTLDDVAPVMRRAIVAIEDSRFYRHGALDLEGTLRAFVNNQTSGAGVQGGSTISQQLVKLTLLNQADTDAEAAAATERSYRRKFQELRYAMSLENRHSKDWILQRYLNLAYFGDGAYGIESAARHFFSRPASELELHQAAMLAGLVKNPTGYDPTDRPDEALARRNVVLRRMAALDVISRAEAREAMARGLGLRVKPMRNGCVSSDAPFFCAYVRRYLLRDPALGRTVEARKDLLVTGGLTIRTTLDLRAQRAADKAVRRHVFPTDRAIGALAMVAPGSGAVRAVAQSRPMGDDKRRGETFLGYAVPERFGDARGFQAGSTFKAFVLSAAIEQGISLSTRIKAPPRLALPVDSFRGCRGRLTSTETWRPANSTGSGTFDLYSGTQQSVNTFFAKLELRTGLCRPYQLAKEMGIELTDPSRQQVPAFTLGVTDTNPLAMAEAYATFAARGVHCSSRPVTEVVDSQGRTLTKNPKQCRRVLDKPVADAVNEILRGVQEPGGFGHSAGLALEQPSAGKTGTTDSNKSVWFVGYTPNMSAAAMIAGADRQGHWTTLNGQVVGGRRIDQAAGSTNAGPVWGDAMKAIQQWLPDVDFPRPSPKVIEGRKVTVPDVVGLGQAEAERRLRRVGLVAELGKPVASKLDPGTIAAARPGPGTVVGSGETVVLRPSGGPKKPEPEPEPKPVESPSPSPPPEDPRGPRKPKPR